MVTRVGGLLVVTALAIGGGRVFGAHRSAEARARRYFLSALDHRAHFDVDGMLRDLRASWTAEPAYLPAVTEAITDYTVYLPTALQAEIDSLAAAQRDRILGECIRGLLTTRENVWLPLELPPHPSRAATVCAAYHRMHGYARPGEQRARADIAWSLWRRYPDSPSFAYQLGGTLGGAGAWEEMATAAVEMANPNRPSFVRLQGYVSRSSALHRLGRNEEAVQTEREADVDTKRSGGGVRLAYLQELYADHAGLLREPGGDSARAAHARHVMAAAEPEMVTLAKHADVFAITGFRLERAERLLDNGELAASLREWDGLASFADSLGAPDLQAHVRVRRGRTLVKLGRTAEAERDLLAGRDFARRANHLQWQYEAEHNLLHLYEAAGSDVEARRAGEAFVKLTQLGGLQPVQLMAHHDLAWFHLRRGERERARSHFETVLAYTDSLAGYDYWAGEYFELTGDLDRAETYFRRQMGGMDMMRAYAGLTRLAEATGDLVHALGYARAHDETGEKAHYPEFAPLLPGMLARHGRTAEAVAGLARSRDYATVQGQVAAWSTLSVDLAVLELRRGNVARAAAIADSAGEAAARVAAAEVGLRARGVAGLARVRLGGAQAPRGLAELRAAVDRVERTHQAQLGAELLTWYGEAFAALGQRTQALATLGRAADLTDSIAVSLALDPARAGYRAAQIQVSNDALAVILEQRSKPSALTSYTVWSLRRKSRGVVEQRVSAPPSLMALEHTLGPGHAIVDYAVLDSAVAALVITSEGAALQQLPVRADTLRARVNALLSGLAPRIGSRVDTAHVSFDTVLAARLYADLLGPLEPILGGRARLTIVADGPLHLLPFDALVVSRTPEVTYAVDRLIITLAPSLATVAGRDAPLPPGPVVAVAASALGDAEVAVDQELVAVAAALRARGVTVLRGPQATEAAVRRYAPAAGLLHFAVHARPNDAQPAFAQLTLTPEGADDGLVHAYEIGDLRLPGTLVVLSACETSAGRLLGGEGVLSLSRAFLRAGASGTVATLWPVGPATSDLMQAFYSALARSAPPAVALREAKLALRHGTWSNPFHWAAFVLVTQDP